MLRTLIFVFLGFTALGCSESSQSSNPLSDPFEVNCEQDIPSFTLGYDAATPTQVNNLCSCIWDSLEGWERETSELLATGRKEEVSALNLRAFPARFGKRIEECGGMSL